METGIVAWNQIQPQLDLPDFDSTTIAQGRHMKFHNLRAMERGGFGQVFRSTATAGVEHIFAIKRLTSRVWSTNLVEYLRKQNRLLDSLRREAQIYLSETFNRGQSTHLAMLHDVAFVKHTINDGSVIIEISEPVLVLEWANAQPDNTLQAWMKANPVSEIGLQERLSLAIQIFSGLVQLHRGGDSTAITAAAHGDAESVPLFVHQDVKPANILLFGESKSGSCPFRLALTDFGLSVSYNGAAEEAVLGGAGTRVYMAPEQWLGLPARTPSRDIWAAGMVLAKMFAGALATKALEEYQHYCSAFKKKETSREGVIDGFCDHAQNIARAVDDDGRKNPATPLSRVQKAIAPLLWKSFRPGRELKQTMLPGHARPTSFQCETALKKIWNDLSFESWELYHGKLPILKPTPLQHDNRHRLALFYLECMERGTLEMMLKQCQRLLHKVAPSDQPTVQKQISVWQQQVQRNQQDTRFHRKSCDTKSMMELPECHEVVFVPIWEKEGLVFG